MEAEDTGRFGEVLRRLRLAAALSQEALAERAGISAAAVQALERGRRGSPRPDTVARLADALSLGSEERTALVTAAVGGSEAPSRQPPAPVTGPCAEPPLPVAGYLGSRAGDSLVARETEMASLLRTLDAALAGEGQTVLLAGEAGVGKTRLAQELTRVARTRGFLVATGCCYETERGVPYFPFLEALATVYEHAPASLRDAAASRWPYLGALLSHYLPIPDGAGGSDEQQRVFLAVGSFLLAVAAQVPLAICLDDLHWADSASIRLLRHLAHHARGSRILILGTYRHVAVDGKHPLTAAIRDLGREGLIERLMVERLGSEETARLIAMLAPDESIPPAFVELIHQRTGGNPFFIGQLLQQVRERGTSGSEDDRWTAEAVNAIGVPDPVRTVIAQRVGRLDQDAQETLHAASVLGQTFTVDDLLRMAPERADQIEEGLDGAETMGLVHETGAGAYRFDHHLTQQAIYHDLSTQRRRRLHRAAAGAIEALPERRRTRRTSELVWHLLEGNECDRAIPYILLAGDRAEAVFAHTEAEEQYRTALRLARESEDDDAIAAANERLAVPLHHCGHFDEALTALEEAASYYESAGDLVRLLPLMAEIAGVHGNRGTPQEGMARIEPLLPRLEAQPPTPSLVYLYAAHGSLLFVLGRAEEHLAVTQRAAAVADELGETRARAVAREQLGLALLSLRQREEARAVLAEAMNLAEAAGDLVTFGLALNNAAYAAEVRGELRESVALFQRGLDLARQQGNPAQTAFMRYALSRNYLESGDWPRARLEAEQAVEISRETGNSWVAPYPVLGLGRVLFALDDPAAPVYLHEGLDLARSNDDLQALDLATCFLAEFDLTHERPQYAYDRLHAAGATESWEPAHVAVSLPTALVSARVLARLGRTREAQVVVNKVIQQAERAEEMLVLAEALAVRAETLLRVDGETTAAQDLTRALSLCRTIDYPYLEARVLQVMGDLHAVRGDGDAALSRWNEARTIFRRLPARREAREVEQALAEHAAGSGRHSAPGA